MTLTFSGGVDRRTLARAADDIADLVAAPEVSAAWESESTLAGMTVGGLTRHLVSQPECAVEFLRIQPPPSHAPVVSLAELYRRTDWFAAPTDAPENTSIREDFNAMAVDQRDAVAILDQARRDLPAALTAAGPLTYVPWQDCSLATEDFVVVRLMEIVVHADDLATSVGLPAPVFADDVVHPAVALLGLLAALQHSSTAAVRALARAERADGAVSAFAAPLR